MTAKSQQSKTTKKISSFVVPKQLRDNVELVLEYLERDTHLSSADRNFIRCLIETSYKHKADDLTSDVTFTYVDLQSKLKDSKLGSTRPTIMERAKTLVDYGILKSRSIYNEGGGRPVQFFYLSDIHRADFRSTLQEAADQTMGGRVPNGTTFRAALKRLANNNSAPLFLKGDNPVTARTDTLFCGLLDKSMRISQGEHINGNRITSSTTIKKCKVVVQSTTLTKEGSELVCLADQRVMRALTSECIALIERQIQKLIEDQAGSQLALTYETQDLLIDVDAAGNHSVTEQVKDKKIDIDRVYSMIPNEFFIDVTALAKLMGYKTPSAGSVREPINKALRRLSDTNFTIHITHPESEEAEQLRNLFGLDDTTSEFRFITSLKSQYESGFYRDATGEQYDFDKELTLTGDVASEQDAERLVSHYQDQDMKRVRFWKISLDPHLFKILLDEDARRYYTFTAHEEIMRESSGLAQMLYNYITGILGRKMGPNGKPRVFKQPVSYLHQQLAGYRPDWQFREDLVRLLKRHTKPGKWDESLKLNVVRMFGYVFTLTREVRSIKDKPTDVYYLSVQLDANDPINRRVLEMTDAA
ncbi:hypothetical protein [Marinobacter salicampi]|uniref:hypothetical protein n=1 Tax=Marinobacter salicampi TaxID=435907 RepID=UPI00140AF8E8|nr:hypothetical protein [Marinobacter salicampi]